MKRCITFCKYFYIYTFIFSHCCCAAVRLSDCNSTSGNSTLCITASTVVLQHNVQADHQQVENHRNTVNSSRNSALDSATGIEIHVLGLRDSLKKEMRQNIEPQQNYRLGTVSNE